jgi:hypothetical protein
MKSKLLVSFLIVALVMVAIGPISAGAYAYESSFRTAITYQNIGAAATTNLRIYFYDSPTDTTPIEIIRPNLARYAGTSVAIGTITEITPGFQGTAVMAADQPLAATMVQNPQDANVKIAPISNGFSSGSTQTLLATVIKNTFGAHTIFSVQNSGTSATTATIKFYAVGVTAPVHTLSQTLQPGAGYFVNMGSLTMPGAYNTAFNGAVVVEASGGGSLVSSAMELDFGSGIGAKAFEGVSQGSTTVYMPSAVCKNSGMNSAFAVQNTSTTTSTDVTVTYQPGGYTHPVTTIPAGGKQSFISCNVLPDNYLGAAKITSTAGVAIIAVGKISGNGAATAYVGFPNGYTKLSLPYVRFADTTHYNSGYMGRTNLTIENTSGVSIPAGSITVTYYDRDGNVAGTPHVYNSALADGAKFNSNAGSAGLTEFGCYNSCTQYGGSAIVTVTGAYTVAVVARHSTRYGSTYPSEDYNGIVVP